MALRCIKGLSSKNPSLVSNYHKCYKKTENVQQEEKHIVLTLFLSKTFIPKLFHQEYFETLRVYEDSKNNKKYNNLEISLFSLLCSPLWVGQQLRAWTLELSKLVSESQCPINQLWPWVSYLASPKFEFLIRKTGIVAGCP